MPSSPSDTVAIRPPPRSRADTAAPGTSTDDVETTRHISEITAQTYKPPAAHPTHLRINGTEYRLDIPAWTTLLDLLRDRLDLTGTKKGCDHGQCGACTVIADGRRINACLALAVAYDDADITTIEGIATEEAGDTPGGLHPIQRAFMAHDAFQCGYCTPGQICSAVALQNEAPVLNRAELSERMSGNLCRCGAYAQIVDAIASVLLTDGDASNNAANNTTNNKEQP
ncbi:(2Fe-2S)-binding protein [Cupriavidus plantarum]|uniref:(2Fe-2S)-binding protein n=1 Tax=Cupriavidus plantarum TaxID=942865 RepID=UPI001B209BE8|nr:(2Fe-2S)-binding protein [Cupriavidus plantarum]CAG2148746.1 hypothetical protein LMG26296_04405 [Cupriavidus plantarum]SMR85272.1 xanthine dehydrogenase YagT iron-sulfur-binding subunit [Cupriavidus plantarum]